MQEIITALKEKVSLAETIAGEMTEEQKQHFVTELKEVDIHLRKVLLVRLAVNKK